LVEFARRKISTIPKTTLTYVTQKVPLDIYTEVAKTGRIKKLGVIRDKAIVSLAEKHWEL